MKFILQCPRHNCRGKEFEAAVIVNQKGETIALDAYNDGDAFYCNQCGSKAIAYKPGKGRTIGDQVTIPQMKYGKLISSEN